MKENEFNKEETLKQIEKLLDDTNSVIVSSYSGILLRGSNIGLLTLFDNIVEELKEDIPVDVIKKSFEMALLTKEEQKKILTEELKELLKKLGGEDNE